ncbi:MAG: hypothetical protein Q8N85_01765 [Candidatus Omnitrophota bacterium]|nr:hypothetical protein [Candidatus Omnitrophota bacterium]
MSQAKVSLIFRCKHWFIYHPWLKIISLALAIIVWHYVKGEIARFNF